MVKAMVMVIVMAKRRLNKGLEFREKERYYRINDNEL
jgi:hypothetical protein